MVASLGIMITESRTGTGSPDATANLCSDVHQSTTSTSPDSSRVPISVVVRVRPPSRRELNVVRSSQQAKRTDDPPTAKPGLFASLLGSTRMASKAKAKAKAKAKVNPKPNPRIAKEDFVVHVDPLARTVAVVDVDAGKELGSTSTDGTLGVVVVQEVTYS